MNLLIVDDHPTHLKLLRAQLEAEGHMVFEAQDGVDALAVLERQRVDAVISDILMPRMDGYQLCHEIRQHARLRDLPIIIYSATYTAPKDEKLARDMGADKYLMRPASVAALVAALDEVIAQPNAAPRPDALREVEVLKAYNERLVSKLKEKNAELQAAEGKFRALVEQSIVGIYIIQDERFVYVNPGTQKIFGWSEEEMTSRTISDFFVPEDHALLRENIRQQISGGVPSVHYSLRALHQSGAVLQVEAPSRRTEYDGRPAVMGMLVDITERKKAEEEAQRSQKRLRDLIDGLGPSMFVGLMTPQGILIEANRPALTSAGLKPEDVLGLPFEETYWWSYSQEVQQQLREAIARAVRGESSRYDVQVRAAENRLIDVDFSLQPLRDETGEVVFLVPSANVITERKQTENALRANEEKFRGLFESSRDAIMTLEAPSWRFTFGNPAAMKMFRAKNTEEFVSLGPREVSPERQPDGRASAEQAMEMIETAMREGSHFFEWMHRRIGGEDFPANVLLTRMEQGGNVILQATVRDITEAYRVRESLAATTELLERTGEMAKVGGWELDLRTMKLHWSLETCRIHEVNPLVAPELEQGINLFTPEARPIIRGAMQAAIDSGTPYDLELPKITAKGRPIWVRTQGAAVMEDGKAIKLLGAFHDITERKAAERQLRDQNEILSNSHEGVMIVNLANEVSLWNRGAEKIFGWTAAEALGRPPGPLLGVDDLGVVSTLRAAVERDGFWNGELRAQTRDGRKLIVDCRTTLVRDEAGRPRARLNFLADITEKKLLEERFLHAQRLESIGMLAAGIAHDLNNVLAPIMFAAPMLRGSLSAPGDLKILDILEQSAGRGAGLVKQILGFAHSTTGEFQPTQVKHLVRDLVSVIEQTFPKSIQLDHQFPSNLWPVQGNATQIHQVLLNLCVNARDAMPSGGTLRIAAANLRLDAAGAGAISGARPGAWVVLEIVDTGTGIPPEVLERIWTPFFTTKGVGKGTGLGLSTIRGIVASHYGFVELHTEVGRGSAFRVFLPAVEAESSRPSTAPPFGIPDGHGELILVVDDDAAIRGIIAAILEQHGYRVVSCGDGVEAITLFSAHPGEISLAVTDVDMPRLGGVALARALLQLRPDIRLLAMSGASRTQTDGSDVPEIRKLAHAFLLKPFKPEDLLGAVHRLLHPPRGRTGVE